MSTKYFNLPYIDPSAPFDGAADINKLADAVDSALETVEVLGRDATFTLEPATRTKLGGVIVGNGVEVGQDGTISVNVDPYELPPATHSSLGGVIVGDGINVTPDGVISIDDAAITLPPNSVGTEQIIDGAVTAPKIANKTITYEKLASSLQSIVNEAEHYSTGQSTSVDITRYAGNSENLKCFAWGAAFFLQADKAAFTSNGGSTFKICKTTEKFLPASGNYFSGAALYSLANVYKDAQFQTTGYIALIVQSSGIAEFTLTTTQALSAGDYTFSTNATFFH